MDNHDHNHVKEPSISRRSIKSSISTRSSIFAFLLLLLLQGQAETAGVKERDNHYTQPLTAGSHSIRKAGVYMNINKAANKATNKATNKINEVTFGDKVLKLRKECKWSQDQLSEYADISTSTIGRIERGEVNPLLENIIKLEKAFDEHRGEKCHLVDDWELQRLEIMMDPDEALQIMANRIARKLDKGLYPDQLRSIERIIDMIVSLTIGETM